MASIEELLLAQAIQDNQTSPEEQALMAAAGAGTGLLLGAPVHAVGKGLENRRIKSADMQMAAQNAVPTRAQMVTDNMRGMRPGARMAGTVGLGLLAGQFGPALKAEAMTSEAAQILGKLQSGQMPTEREQQKIAEILTQQYDNQVGYGVA